MSYVTGITNTLFDLLVPTVGDQFWVPLIIVSVISGALLIWLFRLTTNQDLLVSKRQKLLGHIYELGLYQDNLVTLMRIQKDIFIANLRYLLVSLPALLVLLPVTVIVLVQLESRFERDALKSGDEILIEATVADNSNLDLEFQLQSQSNIDILAGPLVDNKANKIWWKAKINDSQPSEIAIVSAKGSVTKNLAGGSGVRFAKSRETSGWHHLLLNPSEIAIPKDAFLTSIAVHLDQNFETFLGLRWWFWIFCSTSMLTGLLLKNILGVKF